MCLFFCIPSTFSGVKARGGPPVIQHLQEHQKIAGDRQSASQDLETMGPNPDSSNLIRLGRFQNEINSTEWYQSHFFEELSTSVWWTQLR